MAKQQRRAHQRGQSVLEYLLVAAALIGAIVAVTAQGGGLDTAFNDMGANSSTVVQRAVTEVGNMGGAKAR